MRRPRILVVDHRDSFTRNLSEGLWRAGAAVGTVDATRLSARVAVEARIDGLVLSPGPGHPRQAVLAQELFRRLDGRLPILGVCLGHQALALAFGGAIGAAEPVVHGKSILISHDANGLFTDLPNPIEVIRYNSLQVHPLNVGEGNVVTARDAAGAIMGLRRAHGLTETVQFHPESVGSDGGARLLENFVARAGERTRSRSGNRRSIEEVA